MRFERIAVLGGCGFVGNSLCNRLAQENRQLRVLTRNRERNRENMILLPNLELVQADVHEPDELDRHLAGCDAVINLVGILSEPGNDGKLFHRVHVELAEKLLACCKKNGIHRILQMSALNASAQGTSHYMRSVGQAEDLLHRNDGTIHVTSFQPSVIFGPRDEFFNAFARLSGYIPICFPLACPNTRFQPVYVLDVAEMMARALDDPLSYGKRFRLVGPQILSFAELVRYTMTVSGRRRVLIPLPDGIARIQARLFDLLGPLLALVGIEKMFSVDIYNSLQQDSVSEHNDLDFYGIQATSLESVVPAYLANRTQRGRYSLLRSQSGRS